MLCDPRINPFDNIQDFAIAISRNWWPRLSRYQYHVGVFVRPSGQNLKLVHLATHCELLTDKPSEQYYWLACEGLHALEKILLAEWFESVAQLNSGCIPYSVIYDAQQCFDEANGYVNAGLGQGLTCATFLITGFLRFDISFIDSSSWQQRPEDAEWMHEIIKYMKNHYGPDWHDHFDEQVKYFDHSIRFRPEEVAGCASSYQGAPILFNQGIEIGQCIIGEMNAMSSSI